jgi:peptide deformylase
MKVLIFPNVILESQCTDVDIVDEEIKQTVDKMLDAMYENSGIGLAASQVGILKNILVFDCSEDHDMPACLINPEITKQSGEQISREGCLSFPGVILDVIRSSHITVSAINLDGKIVEHRFSGLESACVQHEIDHLRGQTLLNKVNRQMRRKVAKILRKSQ